MDTHAEPPLPELFDGAAGGADEQNLLTVCLIGATGTGKSATGNTFFKRHDNGLFAVSGDPESMTLDSVSQTLPWRGIGDNLRCIDTPGLGDTQSRDSAHLRNIAVFLKEEMKYVNVFLVLFNAEEPKLSSHYKDMLFAFRDTFGQEFIRNLMICFTHWEYDRKAKLKRKKHGSTNEQRTRTMNDQLRATLGHDFDCPCVFLDNTLNVCSEEELKELYEKEAEAVLREFESELDKVHKFASRSEPFCCRDVEAALAARDELRKSVYTWLELAHPYSAEMLGRKLILAEQDIISKGWLKWRRRWIWGVLRRQHLRFYSNERCEEVAGPEHIDLTGCVCCDRRLGPLGRGWCFMIYQVMNEAQAVSTHEFRVEREKERKRWVLLIAEATQISESCHRIQKLYDALRGASTEQEYIKAVDMVGNKTMVIPVEWVRQRGPKACAKFKAPTLKQVEKDLARDSVSVEGRVIKNPRSDDLAIAIARLVVKGAQQYAKEDDKIDAKATVLARDAILSCSRTEGGGDTFDALSLLFGTDLVHLVPDAQAAEPVMVRVFFEEGNSNKGMTAVGSFSGMPEFQDDDSATNLGLDFVRRMELEGDSQLQVTAVGRNEWVSDREFARCMRCGVEFNAWLRRHHCRACGALICFSCGRHYLSTVTPGEAFHNSSSYSSFSNKIAPGESFIMAGDVAAGVPQAPQKKADRVCFLCYQKAVWEDLKLRKEVGAYREDCETGNDSESEAELRVDPMLDNRTVTFEEMCTGLANKGLSEEQLLSHWRDLQPPQVMASLFPMQRAQSVPIMNTEVFNSTSTTSRRESVPLVIDGKCLGQCLPRSNSDELVVDESSAHVFPAVSVEMSSKYKVCSKEPQNEKDAVLFGLDCKYVRVVRWSGLADSGRIFISIVPK